MPMGTEGLGTKRRAKQPRGAARKPVETPLANFQPTAFLARVTTMGLPMDDVAQSYMQFILFRINHILERRRWRVGTLKEFFPRGQSLLGLNVERGQEVCVRFRVPGDRQRFLPFHEVLCTTLHELAHCVHSRHDKVFWSLYYDLVKECEALEVRMVEQGLPLYPPAAPVEDAPACSSPRTLVDRHLVGSGSAGHRLGHGSNSAAVHQSLPTTEEERRQLLAAAAAARQRRLSGMSQQDSSRTAVETVHAPDGVPRASQEEKSYGGWECPRCTFWNSQQNDGQCAMCGDDDDLEDHVDDDRDYEEVQNARDTGTLSGPPTKMARTELADAASGGFPVAWECGRCTYLNSTTTLHTPVLTCDMCGTPRPADFSSQSNALRVSEPTPIIVISDEEDECAREGL